MQRRTLVTAAATVTVLAASLAAPAWAQSGEIRIAHVYSKTGPLEAYGKQTQTGLMMGLQYATGGTMQVNGKKIVVIEKDDQGKPDLGNSLLAAGFVFYNNRWEPGVVRFVTSFATDAEDVDRLIAYAKQLAA